MFSPVGLYSARGLILHGDSLIDVLSIYASCGTSEPFLKQSFSHFFITGIGLLCALFRASISLRQYLSEETDADVNLT